MQLFSADATISSKKNKKKHPQKLLRKTQIHLFILTALSCPNGPNRRIHVPKHGSS